MAFCTLLKQKFLAPHCSTVLFYSNRPLKKVDYKMYYKLLEIPEDSNRDEIRKAYLAMVKRYHPDSCTEEADADRFQEIDRAFRMLMERKSKEQQHADIAGADEEYDIKHTAPQHRQYLSYDGLGYGNPFQRQKQFAKVRAMQASENVLNHRISKAVADEKALMAKVPYKHKIKTKYGLERLVEDLIQEAVSKGEFSNLSGSGKPLQNMQNRNPYVDFVTHKLNEILIDNGFTPEWIMLQKEIREEVQVIRNTLQLERINFPPYPLSIEENIRWSNAVYKHKGLIDKVNKKINKYNLLVPILQRQMLLVSFKKEAQSVLLKGKSNKDVISGYSEKKDGTEDKHTREPSAGIFGLLQVLFKRSG